jgi:acetaldehyde dehydrogenase (acetylating)
VLIAPLNGVGRNYPLSMEKLCPVLSFYVVRDWLEGCERCKEILRYGGMGHTMSIHSQNEHVILEFGLKKPAFRIVVNTPTTHGSIGLTTGLDPAMTLGCGGSGGNITSDNISPKHLLNIKRLAYEITPVANRFERPGTQPASRAARPAVPAEPTGINAASLARRVDEFLGARGFRADRAGEPASAPPAPAPVRAPSPPAPRAAPQIALDFVCEEDVRRAIQTGQKLFLAERAIVTPAARDLGEQHKVFKTAS